MEVFLWIVGVVVVLFIIAAIVGASQAEETANKVASAKKAVRSMGEIDDLYVSPFDQSSLGIAWSARTIYLGTPPETLHGYSFEDVISADIDVDGATVTTTKSRSHTNRGSQAVGAVVGGLIFGPAGLIVGGFTGGKRTSGTSEDMQYVSSIALLIHLRSRLEPIQRVTFIALPGRGIERSSQILKEPVEKVNRYLALLQQIIDENGAVEPQASPANADISESLERLWRLKEAGALTDIEFAERKARLLSS